MKMEELVNNMALNNSMNVNNIASNDMIVKNMNSKISDEQAS